MPIFAELLAFAVIVAHTGSNADGVVAHSAHEAVHVFIANAGLVADTVYALLITRAWRRIIAFIPNRV